jgi:hypothetical protein
MRRVPRNGLLLTLAALVLLGADGSCVPRSQLGTVYALTADSNLARGCFAPLACPIAMAEDIGGTFRLVPRFADGLNDVYAVQEVFWLVRIGGTDMPIRGSGTYFDGVTEDRLRLRLRVGDADTQIFDSGPVPSAPPGSSEFAFTVSIHGQQFMDTVIEIRAVAFSNAAPKTTPCGPTGLTCQRDTEVCVARSPIGPAIVWSCEPVPSGCGADRSCACAGAVLCAEPFDLCTKQGGNRLGCECAVCQ